MKKLMINIKALWKDESAQGATEYILLLVVVVGLALMFKNKISSVVQGKIGEVGGNIDAFKVEGGN